MKFKNYIYIYVYIDTHTQVFVEMWDFKKI